jgi:MFS family permease
MPEPKPTTNTAQPTVSPYPPGLYDAWRFSAFNGLSFQIVLGSPMILYAKTLNASATVLGIIVGMMPLLVIFQIPAAHYIERVGYKRFVLGGWGTRTLFTFAMALVPLTTGFLDQATRLVLILTGLFGFNLVRGIASCAWLPWIASLVPEHLRGRYVSRDAAMSNLGSFMTVVVSAACLGETPHPWQYSIIFTFSAAMGLVSLIFLRRVPDVEITEKERSSNTPVPWLAMLAYPPFRKLLRLVVVWSVAYGGITAFTVAFLKSESGMAEGKILVVTSVAFLGGLSSLWLLGHRLDHFGCKPVLTFALGIWLLILAAWIGLAGGVLAPHLGIVLALQFLMGLFAAMVNIANNRLAMSIIPAMGRNHFFALYSVFANVTLGLAPIAWGLLIDAVGVWHGRFLGLNWTQYTIFFALAMAAFALGLVLAGKLHEPKAARLETLLTEFLVATPQRLWSRFWPRD